MSISPARYAYSVVGALGFGFTPFGAAYSAYSQKDYYKI
jgi:hypothetical protein